MEQLKQKIIKAGYALTKARLAILEYLSNNHISISARDLHKKVKHFDRASVYRTLNLFEELRIVNVEVIDKEKIYCSADEPHHHIICKKCGYMERIECKHSFGHFKNFTNIYHQLTLTGVCNKCALSK
ncbi:MAG: transcriptional repressor [Candidatus Magasanikbacteria bacterium]|jgi:Fe2+ or Zn2+ uptake regulation protein